MNDGRLMAVDPVTRLEELEALLSDLPGEPMLASTPDGFVAGLLVCPTLVLPGEWLPEVWSADAAPDKEPVFETEQQAKDVTRLTMTHYNAVSRALHAGRGRYEVVCHTLPGLRALANDLHVERGWAGWSGTTCRVG